MLHYFSILINTRCVNICNNAVQTLRKCRVLSTFRINPEGLTSVFARGNATASSSHEKEAASHASSPPLYTTEQDRTVPKKVACLLSLVPPLPPFTLSLYRKYEFSFHPRTKSRIVTPVVSQLGQSYLIKSSRGRPFLPYLSFYPSSLPLQVLIKLFLLLRLEVFIISRRSALSQNRRIVIRA